MPLGSYDPPDHQSPAEQCASLLYGGIWLVFMLWPLGAMIAGQAPLVWKIVGVAAWIAFIAVYLVGLTYPRIFTGAPRPVTTLSITLALAGSVALMMPAADVSILTSAPFFMALWLFTYRLLPGIFAALVIALVAVGIGYLVFPNHPAAALDIPVGMVTIILIIVRISTERDELDRHLAEQLALSTQREELGRTVHDVLGHSLTAITVNAQLARRLVRTDPEGAEKQLDQVLDTARTALGEVRQTVTSLSQPELAEQLNVARAVLTDAGFTVRIPREGQLPELSDTTRDVFAWCLREGVTNVVRHSQGSSCSIRVGEDFLQIDDDGLGLTSPENLGLRGLRQRVEEAGGTLTVENHPDHSGTRFQVRL